MKKSYLILILILLVAALIGIKTISFQKKYTTKGSVSKIDFPKLSFNHPPDWEVNENVDEISIAKGEYEVHVDQELITGASVCQFKDSPIPKSPSADLTNTNYQEVGSSLGTLRYFLNPLNNDKTKNSYAFCVKNGNEYMFPEIGFISIVSPINRDDIIFQEALDIVRSIKTLK